jgi:hypothetical protein
MSRNHTGISGILGYGAKETGFYRDWRYLNNKFSVIANITAGDEMYGIGFSLTMSNTAGHVPVTEKSSIKRR